MSEQPIAPHECVWTSVNARTKTLIGVPLTDVLQRCEGCGSLKTETLQGHWSPDDLGIAPRVVPGGGES